MPNIVLHNCKYLNNTKSICKDHMLNNRNQVTYLLPNNLLIERIMTNITNGVHSLDQHSIMLGAKRWAIIDNYDV